MATLQEAAQAMKNLELEASEERNAAQLKRECRCLIQERPSEMLASTLAVDAIKQAQAHRAKWEWNGED